MFTIRKNNKRWFLMKNMKYFIVCIFLMVMLAGCNNQVTNESVLELTYETLFQNQDLNNVSSDLTFITEVNDIQITYLSDKPNVITNEGEVTQQSVDTTVKLTITLSLNQDKLEKEVSVVVLRKIINLEEIYENLLETVDLDNINSNLILPTVINDVSIVYESNDETIIDNTGIVTQTHETQTVGFKITLSYGMDVLNKTEILTVLPNETLLLNYVYDNLFTDFDLNNINNTLDLKSTFLDATITYSSSNSSVFSNYGVVSRTINDEIIVLTTTITIGNHSLVKTNQLRVLKDPELLINHVFDELLIGIDLDNIIDDILLPLNVKDVSITYNSSNQTVLSNSGVVRRSNRDESVELKVSLTYENITRLKSISLTIKEIEMSYLVDELDRFITSGITPTGQQNVLVIPINFTDYKFTEEDEKRLDTAFFGTSEETGWESVQSYYEKSSYGNFILDGTVLEPFETNKASTYYAKKYNQGYDADYEVIKAALKYYDSQIDYSLYDNNDDGYIDGLYFIYAAPVWYGNDTNSTNDSDLWWAYVYYYYSEGYEYYDGVEANYYMWAGIDFMDEAIVYGDYTDEYIDVNASTYIHETGHLLGLYDYYDYDDTVGPDGGLGGADMMDYTVGDHNPFTKIILDWVDPIIVSNQSITITINSFTETGDVILVSPNWNSSYFDEYFLIEYYTPTNLNEIHAGYNGLYSISGIRILHVNAQINPNQEKDYELFLYDNSDTAFKLLKPVEADNDNSVERYSIAEDSDLFQTGDSFGSSTNYKLRNGQIVNFNIEIISLTSTQAEIKITF